MKSTPSSPNYHMPAEWEKQEAIWLSWPHNEMTWARIDRIEEVYAQFVKALHTGQKVNILVNDMDMEQRAKAKLKEQKVDLKQVLFYQIPTVDGWIRDYGPTFVVNTKEKKLTMVKWIFNTWGNKYGDLKEDNTIPYLMNKKLTLPMIEPGIVLEGGSIEVNGKGTLLTTEQCLLNMNRNPQLSRQQIEQHLRTSLGVSTILWLKEGIIGDDTDGHIDDIARFVDPTTVLCAYEDDPHDDNHKILKENYELLTGMRNQDGKKLKIIKLPMPGYMGDPNGRRLPVSYANFYIGNKAIVVPLFDHVNDKKALSIIQDVFPNRKIVGINCREVVEGLGTLHCLSQQQPKV